VCDNPSHPDGSAYTIAALRTQTINLDILSADDGEVDLPKPPTPRPLCAHPVEIADALRQKFLKEPLFAAENEEIYTDVINKVPSPPLISSRAGYFCRYAGFPAEKSQHEIKWVAGQEDAVAMNPDL